MKWLKSALALGLTLTLLTQCSPADSEAVVKYVCPTVQQYTQAELDQALNEYKALPSGSMLKRMIGDYKVVRDQIRACKAHAQ